MFQKIVIACCLFLLGAGGAQAGSTTYTFGLDNAEIPDVGLFVRKASWRQHGVRLELDGFFKEIVTGAFRQGVILYPGSLFVYLRDLADLAENPVTVEVDVVGGITAELYADSGKFRTESVNTAEIETLLFTLNQPGAQLLHVYNTDARADWVDEIRVNVIPIPGALWLLAGGVAGILGFRRKSS